MERQNNYIVFLCYGYERVFHECIYALLSLSRLYRPDELSNTEIWIYTDKPEWFRSFKDCGLPLNYRIIDNTTLQKWKGSIDFVHRVKIEALKDLAKEKKGNILYVDTDSVFTGRIDEMLQDINDGKLYMHVREGLISEGDDPILKKLNKYLSNKKRINTNGKPLQEMAMWNAGVLGFNTKYAHLLDDVLAFTDWEYPGFRKHIVEQWAFSVLFEQEDELKPAKPYIFHYWKVKEARFVLASFFNHFKDKGWEELTRISELVQIQALMQEKADFLHKRGMVGRLLRRQWKPAEPDWSELLGQMQTPGKSQCL